MSDNFKTVCEILYDFLGYKSIQEMIEGELGNEFSLPNGWAPEEAISFLYDQYKLITSEEAKEKL